MTHTTKILTLALLCAALAVPAFAGSVYVPYVDELAIGDAQYRTEVWVTNQDPERIRGFEYYMIRSLADGTQRPTEPVRRVMRPGLTIRLQVTDGPGILEIDGPAAIVTSARLVRVDATGAAQGGTQVPIVSSENLVPAGETAHLQGWERNGNGRVTNLGLLNLANEQTQCLISAFRSDSSQINQTALVTLPARTHIQYPDALGILGEVDLTDARAEVSCDQPFWAYASVYLPSTGDIVFIGPARTGASELVRPGDEPTFDFLSDLDWTETFNVGYGPYRDASGVDPHRPILPLGGYKPIEINGVVYEKGISFIPDWGDTGWVEWNLDGQYQRLTMTVRMDDEKRDQYEWGVVDRATGRFIRLERPAEGFRARETNSRFRIGAGGSLRIWGDGEILFESGEFYGWGPAVEVDVDVSGVKVMRVEILTAHHEQISAPYRNGLTQAPALVRRCSWFDQVDLADAKLWRSDG